MKSLYSYKICALELSYLLKRFNNTQNHTSQQTVFTQFSIKFLKNYLFDILQLKRNE